MASKGAFNSECATPGCKTTGAIGIPGPAPLYESGDVMNVSHRCSRCRESVNRLLVAAWGDDTTPGGIGWASFISHGRDVLRLTSDELHNRAGAVQRASDRDA